MGSRIKKAPLMQVGREDKITSQRCAQTLCTCVSLAIRGHFTVVNRPQARLEATRRQKPQHSHAAPFSRQSAILSTVARKGAAESRA